jgi:hypothetical protein
MPKFTAGESARELYGLLASTVLCPEPIQIVIAVGTVDNVGQAGVPQLRAGLTLVKLTGGADAGKYTHFVSGGSNGQGDSTTGVILMHDTDVETGSDAEAKVATAYLSGTFPRQYILSQTSFDFSKCQRLKFRDDMRTGL